MDLAVAAIPDAGDLEVGARLPVVELLQHLREGALALAERQQINCRIERDPLRNAGHVHAAEDRHRARRRLQGQRGLGAPAIVVGHRREAQEVGSEVDDLPEELSVDPGLQTTRHRAVLVLLLHVGVRPRIGIEDELDLVAQRANVRGQVTHSQALVVAVDEGDALRGRHVALGKRYRAL